MSMPDPLFIAYGRWGSYKNLGMGIKTTSLYIDEAENNRKNKVLNNMLLVKAVQPLGGYATIYFSNRNYS